MRTLRRHAGHCENWYYTRSLETLASVFLSSVDSGNLLASLWTLRQGCLDRLRQPVVQPSLVDGLLDCLRILCDAGAVSRKRIAACERLRKTGYWPDALTRLPLPALDEAERAIAGSHPELNWFVDQTRRRVEMFIHTLRAFCLWSLPVFADLRDDPALNLRLIAQLPLEQLPEFMEALVHRLQRDMEQASPSAKPLYDALAQALPPAQANVAALIEHLRRAARKAGEFADEMDSSLLLATHCTLLCIVL